MLLTNRLTATSLLSLFRSGALSCEDYMERVVSRAESMKDYNYFTHLPEGVLMERARKADNRYR